MRRNCVRQQLCQHDARFAVRVARPPDRTPHLQRLGDQGPGVVGGLDRRALLTAVPGVAVVRIGVDNTVIALANSLPARSFWSTRVAKTARASCTSVPSVIVRAKVWLSSRHDVPGNSSWTRAPATVSRSRD